MTNSTRCRFAVLLFLSLFDKAGAQEPPRPAAEPSPEQQAYAEKIKAAIDLGEFHVKLRPMTSSPMASGPNWSPYGTKVPLKTERDELVGKLTIGQRADFDVSITFPQPGADAEFWIDENRDGVRGDQEVTAVKGNQRRGSIWYSGRIALNVPLKSGGSRSYPINYWYVASPDRKPDEPYVMRWTRRGWMEGTFKFGDREAFVMMTEAKADGHYDESDAWGLGLERREMYRNSSSRLAKHAWLDGVAFKPTRFDPDGLSISFKAFDAGITQEEERERNDPYAADKKLSRAKAPVKFSKDLKAALAAAKEQEKLVFVDFVTVWCGPCKVMDKYVYTSKLVVDRMKSVIPVQLDGDEEKEIVERYQITGYPTLLVLDSDGEVVQRMSGYASAARLKTLLETAAKEK